MELYLALFASRTMGPEVEKQVSAGRQKVSENSGNRDSYLSLPNLILLKADYRCLAPEMVGEEEAAWI